MRRLFSALLVGLLASVGNAVCTATRGGTTTPNMGLYKPAINECTWGDSLNSDFSIIDSSAPLLNGLNIFTSTNTFNNPVIVKGPVRFYDQTTHYIQLQASPTVTTTNFTLMSADGTKGQALTTNGSGVLSFNTIAGTSIYPASATANFPFGLSASTVVVTGLSSNQCVQTNGSGQLTSSGGACGGGSGGSSSLQVTQSGVQITSPTASINFTGPPFLLTANGSTSTIALNASSVTLQGNNLSATYLTNSSATATYLQLSSAAATYVNKNNASTGGGIVSPGTFTWTNNFGLALSTLTVTQTNTGNINAVVITSTGTGSAIQVTGQGSPAGGVQQRQGYVTIGDDTVGKPIAAQLVLVDSTTDSQVGAGMFEIWEDNPNHNDPIVWVRRNSSTSGPEFRVDGLAPNFETVDTSTANTIGRGKYEIYAQPFQSEILQMPNSRCYDNSSFESEAYWEPLNIEPPIGTPGIYLKSQDSTGCDSGVVTSSNTSGINFYTTNAHTIGLTGPLNVASGSWRIRLPGTIPVSGQVLQAGSADAFGDYPTSWVTSSAGSGSSALGVSSGSALNSVIVSSPTTNIVVDSNTIIASLQGTTSSFLSLNPSSVTLQGQNVVLAIPASLQTTAFEVSSGSVIGNFNANATGLQYFRHNNRSNGAFATDGLVVWGNNFAGNFGNTLGFGQGPTPSTASLTYMGVAPGAAAFFQNPTFGVFNSNGVFIGGFDAATSYAVGTSTGFEIGTSLGSNNLDIAGRAMIGADYTTTGSNTCGAGANQPCGAVAPVNGLSIEGGLGVGTLTDPGAGTIKAQFGVTAATGAYSTSLTVAGNNVCQSNGTNCPASGGGGASSLQVTSNGVQITSPTASMNFSTDFLLASVGSTATIAHAALDSGITTFSSSITVNNPGGITSTAGVNSTTGYQINGATVLTSTNSIANLGVGFSALPNNTTSLGRNVAIGNSSLGANTTGQDNVSIGYAAGFGPNASSNTFVGYESGEGGSFNLGANTMIGYSAGKSEQGTNNVYIGANTDSQSSSLTNAIALGSNITPNASNTIILGSANAMILNSSVTTIGGVKMIWPSTGTIGDVLSYISTNTVQWVANGSGGSGITALTGDVTASGTGSVVATAASLQNNITTFGSSITVSGAGGELVNFGVTAGTYNFINGNNTAVLFVNGNAISNSSSFQWNGSTMSATKVSASTITATTQLNVTGALGENVTYGITASTFTGNGAGLTNISAGSVTGILSASVLPSTVVYTNTQNVFTTNQLIAVNDSSQEGLLVSVTTNAITTSPLAESISVINTPLTPASGTSEGLTDAVTLSGTANNVSAGVIADADQTFINTAASSVETHQDQNFINTTMTVTNVYGDKIINSASGGGSVVNSYGLNSSQSVSASTITSNYGLFVQKPNILNGGQITTNTAIYIDTQNVASANSFGIYQTPNGGQNVLSTTTITNLNLTGISGTQCLHSVAGQVVGTGSDCGSGGSGGTSSGTIVQTIISSVTVSSTTAVTSFVNTGLSLSITPKSLTDYVRLSVHGPISSSAGGAVYITVAKNGVNMMASNGCAENDPDATLLSTGLSQGACVIYDTAPATSATTYTVQLKTASGTGGFGDTNVTSYMIAEEINPSGGTTGAVNTGTANQIATYASAGTAVSGSSNLLVFPSSTVANAEFVHQAQAGALPVTGGDIRYDTTQDSLRTFNNITASTASIPMVLFSSVPIADIAFASNTTISTMTTQFTFPPNFFTSGKIVTVSYGALANGTATVPNFNQFLVFKNGSNGSSIIISSQAAVAPVAGFTNGQPIYTISCLSSGSSGQFYVTLQGTGAGGFFNKGTFTAISLPNIDTTVSQTVQLVATFSAATTGNWLKLLSMVVTDTN